MGRYVSEERKEEERFLAEAKILPKEVQPVSYKDLMRAADRAGVANPSNLSVYRLKVLTGL